VAKAIQTRSLHDLSRRFNKLAQKVDPVINQIVEDITYATVAHIARATPIDVGTARSNWIVSYISESAETRPAFFAYPSRWKPPYGAGGSFGEGRNTAGATWSVPTALRGRRTGQAVYITNNLPYIERLNSGWSKQAPAGFVDRAIAAAQAQVETELEETLGGLDT